MAYVTRPLVQVNGRRARSDKSWGSPDNPVGSWNQVQQFLYGRVCGLRPLCIAEHIAGESQTLPLTKPFIAEEEERAVLSNRAAERCAELIALEGRRFQSVEEVARVERIIAQELECFSMKPIRARARGNVHDRAGVPAILRAERRVIHLEFLHCVDRRLKRDLVLDHIIEIHAVDHKIHRVFAVASRVECERALPAQRRSQESVLRRRDRSGYQQPKVNEVAAVERNLLHSLLIDHLADCAC